MRAETSPLAAAQDARNIDSRSWVAAVLLDCDGAPLLHGYVSCRQHHLSIFLVTSSRQSSRVKLVTLDHQWVE